MSTIVFIVADLVGHVHSAVGVAGRLESRGHRVLLLGPPGARRRVEQQGLRFEAAPFLEPFPDGRWRGAPWAALLRARRERRALARRLAAAPAAAAAVVNRFSPDLLIFDPFLLMYAAAFHPFRIPLAALSTKPLLDWDPWVPPYTSPVVPRRGPGGLVRVQASWTACWLRYALYKLTSGLLGRLAGYTAYDLTRVMADATGFPLRREWSMRPVPFDFRFRSVPEIVLTARELDLPRALPLRPQVRYAGPCADLDRREPELYWRRIRCAGRLVVAALGTVDPLADPRTLRFLRELVTAFRHRPSDTLLLAAGSDLDADTLGRLPHNVHLFSYLPQIEALRRADLFIGHGGSSSLKEAVLLAVPLLVYPRRADQPGNAARVVFHGIGLAGNPGRDTSRDIERKVGRLLDDPSFLARLLPIRRQMLRYALADLDVKAFEELLPDSKRTDR